MAWLVGEERTTSYVLRVHLDMEALTEEGNPVPGSVFERKWGKDQDLEVSKTEHWLLAEHHLAQQVVTPLAME